MSREIEIKTVKDALRLLPFEHKSDCCCDLCMKLVAVEDHIRIIIERLLADERDRGAAFIIDLTKKYDALLAAEQEKVREMCAKEAESWNDTTDWSKARQKLPFRIAKAIRQLDLTQDLAPSSAEEGGDAK